MTPKEKAEELLLKFSQVPIEGSLMWYVAYEFSKQFSLIVVDELIKETGSKYWYEVKQEIDKL